MLFDSVIFLFRRALMPRANEAIFEPGHRPVHGPAFRPDRGAGRAASSQSPGPEREQQGEGAALLAQIEAFQGCARTYAMRARTRGEPVVRHVDI